jgi:hypothetical protein
MGEMEIVFKPLVIVPVGYKTTHLLEGKTKQLYPEQLQSLGITPWKFSG